MQSLLWQKIQTSNTKTNMRAKMSTVSNKGFMMRYKAVAAIVFTVVGPTPKLNRTSIAKPKASLKPYIYINWSPISVTPSHPIISPSHLFNLLQFRMANSNSSSISNHYLQYCAALWTSRRRTWIVEAAIGLHIAFVIISIEAKCVLLRIPCVCCERIT